MLKKSRILKVSLFIALIIGIRQVYRYVAIRNADAIVQVEYNELKYMFHTQYNYYAIGSGGTCKVPKRLVKKWFGEDVEQRDRYNDEETLYWNLGLFYSEDSNFKEERIYLNTPFGDQYRLGFNDWLDESKLPDTATLKAIQRAAETIYGGYLKKWERWGVPYRKGFFCIQNGEKLLIEIESYRIVLDVSREGDITRILKLPDEGSIVCYFFLDSD